MSCPRTIEAKRPATGGRGQDTKNGLNETAARRAAMGGDVRLRDLAKPTAPAIRRSA